MEAAAADNILRFGPEAPVLLHLMAAVLLFLHIAGASVAMVAGAVALIARKGDRVHRAAGVVFVISMLVMLAVAAGTSPFLPDPQPGQVYGGLFVIYLVATAWMTVKRPAGQVGRFEPWACIAAAVLALAGVLGAVLGDPPAWAFAAVAGFAVFCDVRVLRRGGLSGPPRIARHLWRMCAALFVATGSFFFGQADEIPAVLRGPHLTVLALAPLGLMVFWLIRIRIGRAFKTVPRLALEARADG
ncbi:MAG: hypothetical protein ACXW3O_05045 [Brevundimonas sp.]